MILFLLACSSEPSAPPPPPPPPEAVEQLPAPVAKAVELAKVVQADPANADAVLAAKGSSRAELDGLLYEIARDPTLTDAYARALGK